MGWDKDCPTRHLVNFAKRDNGTTDIESRGRRAEVRGHDGTTEHEPRDTECRDQRARSGMRGSECMANFKKTCRGWAGLTGLGEFVGWRFPGASPQAVILRAFSPKEIVDADTHNGPVHVRSSR